MAYFALMPFAFVVLLGTSVSAYGNGLFESVYTPIELEKCRAEPVPQQEGVDGGVWWCEGYRGMPVRVAEGDLRMMVSYGPDAGDEVAANQTLSPFNTIGKTLEWRLERSREDGSLHPIATILRYFTDTDGGPKGQILVVTKLGGKGQICQLGYVDAILNPDANTIARQVAEQEAAAFDCGTDQPRRFGLSKD